METMLSVREASRELRARGFNLSERAIREEIKKKRLRARKIRGVYYISTLDLEVFIRASETMPADEDELKIGA